MDYQTIKHSLAMSSLVQVQSLPRELVRSRSGVNIPAPFPVREETKSDEIEVDAIFDSTDYGYCECWPDLQVPMVQTRSNQDLFTADPIVIHAVHQTDKTLAESAYGIAPTHQTAMRSHGLAGNAIRIAFNISGVNTNVDLRLNTHTQPYNYPVTVYIELYDSAVGWTGWYTFGGNNGDSLGWDSGSVAVPAAVGTFQYIRTVVGSPDVAFLKKRRLVFDLALQPAPGSDITIGFVTPGQVNWDVCQNASWPYLPELPDIDRVRNLGYEALLTYTGSRQLDGGKIAGALVPFDWSPLDDNPYNAVASVRHNKFSAALRSGAHGTWRVSALSELDPVSPECRSFPGMKLVFGYQRNNAENQSLRIRATGVFGVYSDSPIIGLAPFVTALTPVDLELLMEYFQTAPAVTENPLHEKLKSAAQFIGRALRGAGSVAKEGAKIVVSHPEVAAAIAAAAGQPELALGLESYAAARSSKRQSKQSTTSQPPRTTNQPSTKTKAKPAGKQRR